MSILNIIFALYRYIPGMSYPAPSTSTLQSTERIGQSVIARQSQPQRYVSFYYISLRTVNMAGFMGNSPHTTSTSAHILDDYSLNIFYVYRLFLLSKDDFFPPEGDCEWAGERWWYKLAHVCRRWRNLILGSVPFCSLLNMITMKIPTSPQKMKRV